MMKAAVNVRSAAAKCAVMSCRYYRHTSLQICKSRQNLRTSTSKFESRLQPRTIRSLSLDSSTCAAENADSSNRSRFAKFLRFMGKLDYSETKLKYAGLVLYTKCTDGISYEEFIKYCHLADTFFSWFLITELHVWMCMVRLKQNGAEGLIVRNSLISALWKDTKERAKLLGAVSMGQRSEEIDQLHQQFLAAIFLYDEGLLTDDKTLAGALWRQLLQRDCEKPEVLEGLVHYIRKQTLHLESYSKEDIVLKGHVTWVPLPNPNMHDQL